MSATTPNGVEVEMDEHGRVYATKGAMRIQILMGSMVMDLADAAHEEGLTYDEQDAKCRDIRRCM